MTARSVGIATIVLCAALLTTASVRAQDAVAPQETTSFEDSAPVGTRANYFTAPYRTGSFRHMDRIFPYHMVYRAGPVSELPVAEHQLGKVSYTWKGATHTLDDLLRISKTTGFLVIKNGKIVQERYFGAANENSTFTSMSVAKSFTSTLVGLAIADGKIKSVDDPITEYLPEFKGTGYDGVPIKAILQMSSGVKFTERYIPGRYSDMDLMFERGMIDENEPLNDYLKG
ncbi:MAG TPA: serine hydrolase, partial [Candidatus Binataceae bacterium]|nr:serine hydrolase [Candidatus Binataceae bacterium]